MIFTFLGFNKTVNTKVQSSTAVEYGHLELPCEEKSKFEHKEKTFSLVLKVEF